jgi:ribosomal protein S27E
MGWRFLEWYRRVMTGRYGTDQLTFALLGLYFVLWMAGQVSRLYILALLSLVPLVLCFYRMFSRNTGKRYRENVWFMNYWSKVRLWFFNRTNRIKDRKVHRYYKCPKCANTLRVPKGRGKICITCPVCGNQFIKKT